MDTGKLLEKLTHLCALGLLIFPGMAAAESVIRTTAVTTLKPDFSQGVIRLKGVASVTVDSLDLEDVGNTLIVGGAIMRWEGTIFCFDEPTSCLDTCGASTPATGSGQKINCAVPQFGFAEGECETGYQMWSTATLPGASPDSARGTCTSIGCSCT